MMMMITIRNEKDSYQTFIIEKAFVTNKKRNKITNHNHHQMRKLTFSFNLGYFDPVMFNECVCVCYARIMNDCILFRVWFKFAFFPHSTFL